MKRGGLLFVTLALAASAHTARADVILSDQCPPADDTQGYVDAALRPGSSGMEGALKLYYKLLKPFDPAKKTLLVINGGPGGDHSVLFNFQGAAETLGYNVVSFDHRGLGCTQI